MKSYICCGMQYGDEGKGSFIDWLTYHVNADCIVKYNGGSQASHTVLQPDGKFHKFSQLGSGMFKKDCHTYITEDMIVNPENILREIEYFSAQNDENIEDIINRIHIHENCWVVTPYHKLLNRMRELSLGDNRRGSVGTGVSEVPILCDVKNGEYHKGLGVQMKDLFFPSIIPLIGCLEELQYYVKTFYIENEKNIWTNCPDDLKDSMHDMIDSLLSPKTFMKIADIYDLNLRKKPLNQNLKKCLYNNYENTLRKEKIVIWEGSQGFLIDKNYGIAPNITNLVTTNEPALDIAYLRDDITKIGITKAFCSRHGIGVFPTEDTFLNDFIIDNNQDESYWNGNPRYGWFDAVLFRYAAAVNKPDEIFLSSLDKLNGLEKIKICKEYIYNGKIDKEFENIFIYHINKKEEIIITDIKKNNPRMKEFLSKCQPVYLEIHGWDNLNIHNQKDVWNKCRDFILELELNIKHQIKVISIGPTRNDKIIIDSRFREYYNDNIEV